MKIAYRLGAEKIEIQDGALRMRIPAEAVPILKDIAKMENTSAVLLDIDLQKLDNPIAVSKDKYATTIRTVTQSVNSMSELPTTLTPGIITSPPNIQPAIAIATKPQVVEKLDLQVAGIQDYILTKPIDLYLPPLYAPLDAPPEERYYKTGIGTANSLSDLSYMSGITMAAQKQYCQNHLNHSQSMINANPNLIGKVSRSPTPGLPMSNATYQMRVNDVRNKVNSLGSAGVSGLGGELSGCNSNNLSVLSNAGSFADGMARICATLTIAGGSNFWGAMLCIIPLLLVVTAAIYTILQIVKMGRGQVLSDNGGSLSAGENSYLDAGEAENQITLAGMVDPKKPLFYVFMGALGFLGYTVYNRIQEDKKGRK